MGIRRTTIDRVNEARKSFVPTIGKGKPLDARGNEGDLTFRRTSEGLKLYIKANHKWHGIKVGESFDSLEKKINEIKSKVDTIKQFRLPSTYSVTGDFTLDVSGDIEINADGGQVTIKDDTASHFLFDCDATRFTIYDDTNASDYIRIAVGANGASTISTFDSDGILGHLTMLADGNLIAMIGDGDESGQSFHISLDGANNRMCSFFGEADNYSGFRIYEFGGQSTSDYFEIKVEEEGLTTISTVDAAAAAANLTMAIDGDITLDSADEIVIDHTNRFKFKKAGTEYVKWDVDGSSQLTMFEQGGLTTNDYFKIDVATHGATTLQTVDAAGADADLTLFPDGDLILKVGSGGTFMKEAASAATDKLGYGQLWVKNATPNELYFTNAAGADIQITSGSSIAGGGGGTSRWSNTSGGYKTNNNSSTTYYFQYYPNYHVWANSDSSPTTLSYTDSYAYNFCAPADGALTNITVTCRASDTGATDPLKFYVFKGVPSNEATTVSLTQIGVTGTITPVSAKQMHLSTDISSSNTFSAGDKLWIMLKKDSTTANQDLYFAVTISGTYS